MPKHSELLRLWGIQESVLQSYRSIFLSAESFMISGVSVLLALSKENPEMQWAIYPLAILGFYLAYTWKRLTTLRGKSVYFCQSLVIKCELGKEYPFPLSGLKRFLHDEKYQKDYILNDEEYSFVSVKDGTEDFIRKSMQRLPLIFMGLWVIIVILAIIVACI